MKRLITMIFLAMMAPPGSADQCSERLIKLADPVFPRSLEEIRILEQEKSCSINLVYTLNAQGRAENIEYRAEKGTCRLFNVPAIRAIRSSRFSEGAYLFRCYINVRFEFQDGRMAWRFDEASLIYRP